jgi:non-specific protein-tyrosine kinase
VRDTQLIRVAVSDRDPDQAALIANTIASVFSRYVADESLRLIESTRASLDAQIADIQKQVEQLDSEISALDTESNRDNASVRTQIEDLRAQRSRLQQQIADLQVQGQSASLGIASAQTQVTLSAQAQPPSTPYAPRIAFSTTIGVLAGLAIAVGVIFLLQYMDNSVNAETDFQQLAGVPVLSTVAGQPSVKPGGNQVYTLADPRSSATEAIRLLRANLEFSFAGHAVKSVTITSANSGEGKSTVSANLAVVMAQAGLSTVLIDADLRKPTQHKIFGVANDVGLTTLLTHPEQQWRANSHRVATANLILMPCGPIPPNPSDLLSLDRFPQLLNELSQETDIIIVDTPPVLAVADPLVVARKTDACLLITRSGTTRLEAVRKVVESFRHGNVHLLGVVVNLQKLRSGGYYYYQYGEQQKGLRHWGRSRG